VAKGGCTQMKKTYEKPIVESEAAFETLAGGCTLQTDADGACNPAFGGSNLNAPSTLP
jgi:hypothetical protein